MDVIRGVRMLGSIRTLEKISSPFLILCKLPMLLTVGD